MQLWGCNRMQQAEIGRDWSLWHAIILLAGVWASSWLWDGGGEQRPGTRWAEMDSKIRFLDLMPLGRVQGHLNMLQAVPLMPGLALPCQLSLSSLGRARLMHQAHVDGLGQLGQDENLGFPAYASLSPPVPGSLEGPGGYENLLGFLSRKPRLWSHRTEYTAGTP